jgi:primosomal protein N' (replication factor Y)
MDLDTTRNKNSYERIIGDFERKKIQILIGTQMITKGLDFDSVSIVGILNADNMLNYPDFRAFERSYQMMAQVSGRAGRKGKQGLVILQTSDPQHPVIQNVVKNDFLNSYKTQLEERLLFRYPPFHRLINITIKHKDKVRCDKAAQMLGAFMSRSLGDRVLGPQAPPINRIQNLFLNKLLVKIEKNASIKKVKSIITQGVDWVKTDAELKGAIFQIDVDPM